jgi:hypothetical protein
VSHQSLILQTNDIPKFGKYITSPGCSVVLSDDAAEGGFSGLLASHCREVASPIGRKSSVRSEDSYCTAIGLYTRREDRASQR